MIDIKLNDKNYIVKLRTIQLNVYEQMSLDSFKNNVPNKLFVYQLSICVNSLGGARGVMVIVVGNGYSDTSSNPGRD